MKMRLLTQEWLDGMFRPIRTYLHKHHLKDADRIVEYLHFMCRHEGGFEYKNCMTRDYVVVDKEGNLLRCGPSALEFEFRDVR